MFWDFTQRIDVSGQKAIGPIFKGQEVLDLVLRKIPKSGDLICAPGKPEITHRYKIQLAQLPVSSCYTDVRLYVSNTNWSSSKITFAKSFMGGQVEVPVFRVTNCNFSKFC
jgi:hypothetical protein